jgi:glycosyltransferase involved in cell wall biosynthesis
MHIAFFTNFYLPVVNGVSRSVEVFRDALMKRQHNVFVFAQAANEYVDKAPFIFRYPALALPVSIDVPAVIPVSSFADQLLPILKPDVIHTHHPILLGQTAARKAKELNVPLVFTFHTRYQEYTHYIPLPMEAIQEFIKGAIQNWLKEFMRSCQHIVIPSESMKEIVIRDYGLQDCYTVIPTGMDLQPYVQADGKELRARLGWQKDKVLISVGRLGQEKNWPVLLQAVKKLKRKHPDLRMVLIGDGLEKNNLQQLAAELGIADRVTFTGELPFSEVPAYLKAADIFSFASITETQGLVTMEAMAAGLPIVAVNGSGTSDIVEDGKQGFLVPNNASALAKALDEVLNSPSLMKRFQRNALRKSKTFDVEVQTKKLLDVYQQAIQDKAQERHVTILD